MQISRILSISALAAAVILADETKPPVGFNRDIRPIMSDTCFRCHGPDKNARMVGLRLDIRAEAVKGTKYEGHWAYQPVKRPPVPGAGNPIDALIQERLAREGLKLSPEADRRTLI